MSITVAKDKGVTVVTFTSDCKSVVPPLCQIRKNLCYSPQWCSAYKGLMQPNVVSALGAIQIMVGLFSIGLGPGRSTNYYYYDHFADLGAAYWLGIVVNNIVVPVLEKQHIYYVFSLTMLSIGLIFAIFGIVMYSIDLGSVSVQWITCLFFFNWSYLLYCTYKVKCRLSSSFLWQRLLTAIDITMIVLTVLQLCVCISFAVLSIKALQTHQIIPPLIDDLISVT
uniref:Uncharacterized protein n=1 Tax=Mola mola TaxID=94237 RepID=A0A3Q4BP55_MOLML